MAFPNFHLNNLPHAPYIPGGESCFRRSALDLAILGPGWQVRPSYVGVFYVLPALAPGGDFCCCDPIYFVVLNGVVASRRAVCDVGIGSFLSTCCEGHGKIFGHGPPSVVACGLGLFSFIPSGVTRLYSIDSRPQFTYHALLRLTTVLASAQFMHSCRLDWTHIMHYLLKGRSYRAFLLKDRESTHIPVAPLVRPCCMSPRRKRSHLSVSAKREPVLFTALPRSCATSAGGYQDTRVNCRPTLPRPNAEEVAHFCWATASRYSSSLLSTDGGRAATLHAGRGLPPPLRRG